MQRQRAIDDLVALVLGRPTRLFTAKPTRRKPVQGEQSEPAATPVKKPPPRPPIVGWGDASTAHNSPVSRR